MDDMKAKDFLDYEIRSSWWACFVWWGWGQAIIGKYFAWKTNRKHRRYLASRRDMLQTDSKYRSEQ